MGLCDWNRLRFLCISGIYARVYLGLGIARYVTMYLTDSQGRYVPDDSRRCTKMYDILLCGLWQYFITQLLQIIDFNGDKHHGRYLACMLSTFIFRMSFHFAHLCHLSFFFYQKIGLYLFISMTDVLKRHPDYPKSYCLTLFCPE